MPARTKISFDLTATEQAIMTKLGKVEANAAKLQKKLDDVGKTGKKSFKGIQKNVKDVAASLVGPVSLAGAATIAANSIRQAFESVKEESQKTLEVIERTGKARVFSLLNTLAVFGSREKMDAAAMEISQDAGVSPEKAFEFLGVGVTAGGTPGKKGSLLPAAKLAALFDRFGIEGKVLLEGIITMGKALNETDAKKLFGFVQQVGTASKIVNPESQLNLIKGIVALLQKGASARDAGIFTTAATQLNLTDKEGRRTSTGLVNLASKLNIKELDPTQTFDPKTGKTKTTFKRLEGAGFNEKLKNLQKIYDKADDELKKDIIKQYAPEKTFEGAFFEIISNSSRFKKEIVRASAIIKAPGAATTALAQKTIEAAKSGGAGGVIEAGGRGAAAIERGRFQKTGLAAAVQAEKIEAEAISLYGSGFLKFLRAILPFTGVKEFGTPGSRATGALFRTQEALGVPPDISEERQNELFKTIPKDQQEIIKQLKELVRIAQKRESLPETSPSSQTE